MYCRAKYRVEAPEIHSILYITLLTLSENIVDLNENEFKSILTFFSHLFLHEFPHVTTL